MNFCTFECEGYIFFPLPTNIIYINIVAASLIESELPGENTFNRVNQILIKLTVLLAKRQSL